MQVVKLVNIILILLIEVLIDVIFIQLLEITDKDGLTRLL